MTFIRVPRPDGFNDCNDCTVRALANATGMPYEQAHKVMAEAGRQPGKGMTINQYGPIYDMFGTHTALDVQYVAHDKVGRWGDPNGYKVHKRGMITVKRFLQEHPKGSFIVKIKGHVFAVKDGVILDLGNIGPNKRVSDWWTIFKK